MAIFELTKTTEVDTVWAAGDGRTQDFLGMLMRDAPDQPWYVRYRFRYYCDDSGDPEAPDAKDVFELRGKPEMPVAVDQWRLRFERVFEKLVEASGWDHWTVPVHGGPEAFNAAMKDYSFMHARMEWLH